MERKIYDSMRRLQDNHWWFRARRDILFDQIKRLGILPAAKILEVGCGVGGNLPLLRRFGSVVGLEPDAESRAFAAEKAGVPVMDGSLPDNLPFQPQSFNLILALDVIEHIVDDQQSVQSLARLLSPGGAIIVTVPAYQWMWSRHDIMHHHRRRYNIDQVKRLLNLADLQVCKATYFNAILFPLIAAVRLTKVLFKLHGMDEDVLPSRAMNAALLAIFRFELFCLRRGNFPFGVSIMVIGKKGRTLLPSCPQQNVSNFS